MLSIQRKSSCISIQRWDLETISFLMYLLRSDMKRTKDRIIDLFVLLEILKHFCTYEINHIHSSVGERKKAKILNVKMQVTRVNLIMSMEKISFC